MCILAIHSARMLRKFFGVGSQLFGGCNRSLASAIVAIGTLLASAPAPARSYDPNCLICMHVYGELEGEQMDCIFTSLASAQHRPQGEGQHA